MKKILFSLIALVCGMSINAQIIEVYKGETLVATYKANKADRVVFKEAPVVESPFSWTVGNSIALMDGTNYGMYNYVSGSGDDMSSFTLAGGQPAGANSFALHPYALTTHSEGIIPTQAEAEAAAGEMSWQVSEWKRDYESCDEYERMRFFERRHVGDELDMVGVSDEDKAIIYAYISQQMVMVTVPGVELDGTSIKNVVIPVQQTATAGSADPQAMVRVAKLDGESLVFTDVCAYIKVTPLFDCYAIGITSKGNEQLAGKVTIEYGDDEPTTTVTADGSNGVYLVGTITAGNSYYIAVRPEALASGYNVEFLTSGDKKYYGQGTDDELVLERGNVEDLGSFSTSDTWDYADLATSGISNGHSWILLAPGGVKMATEFISESPRFADLPDWGDGWRLPSLAEYQSIYNNGYYYVWGTLTLTGKGILRLVADVKISRNTNWSWTSTPDVDPNKQVVFYTQSGGSYAMSKTTGSSAIYLYTK